MEIFNDFFEPSGGLAMIARAGHILVGIAWIGLLYFFNVVQVPAYAEFEPAARNQALDKLTWRALWWFRWAAAATFFFGVVLLGIYTSDTSGYLKEANGASILTGILFGVVMLSNVWGVIWPNQQIVIGNARRVLAGAEPDPAAPAAAKRAARASRTNTFLSIPLLWYMVFTTHYSGFYSGPDGVENGIVYWLIVLATLAYAEASALGLVGGIDSAWNRLVLDDHRKTIIYGFVYLAVLHFVGWELILNGR